MKRLPKYFTDMISEIYTAEEQKIINEWFAIKKRATTFRLNTLKLTQDWLLKSLEEKKIEVVAHPTIPLSFSLISEEDNTKLWNSELIANGSIYLQSLSSQLPVHFLELDGEEKVLDLAAAPWGKTSQLATHLNNNWAIIALDNNEIRVEKLRFTLKRQWVTNTTAIKIDARKFSENYSWDLFDSILFDAPCSAEWRINLNEEKNYEYLSVSNNKKNYYLQRDILKKNIALLKDWWELIYSTCTLSPMENEWIVHFLLCNFPELEILELDIPIFWNMPIKNWITHFWNTAYTKEVSKSMRVLPSVETEWFFIAKFRKKSAE